MKTVRCPWCRRTITVDDSGRLAVHSQDGIGARKVTGGARERCRAADTDVTEARALYSRQPRKVT